MKMKKPWTSLISRHPKVSEHDMWRMYYKWLNTCLAPSKAELQLALLEEERTSSGQKGSTTLLAQGLKIEEAQ